MTLGTATSRRLAFNFLHDPQFVMSEADDLDIQVIVNKIELVFELNEGIALPQQSPQNVRKLDDHLARLVRIEAHQRGNGVQGVEQEVRIDLALQRLHAGLQQQTLLLLNFISIRTLLKTFNAIATHITVIEVHGNRDQPVRAARVRTDACRTRP